MKLTVFIHRETGLQVVWNDERGWWEGPASEPMPDQLEAAPPGDVDCIVLEKVTTRADGPLWAVIARCACTPYAGMEDCPAQPYGQDLPA